VSSLRRIALEALVDIAEDGAWANLRLKQLPDSLTRKERDWAYAAVYATLEHLSYIDFLLAHLAKRQKRLVRNVLRLSAAQILYMRVPSHAAVSEGVALCREIGKASSCALVNAVLRKLPALIASPPPLPTDPVDRFVIQYGCPEWAAREWVQVYGENFTEDLLTAPAMGMTVRAQYPTTNAEVAAALPVPYRMGRLDKNCFCLERGFAVTEHPLFVSGGLTVQGQAAMAVCRTLGDVRGKKILDACAAPGGKSAYLYSLAQGELDLTCWELHPHRLALLDATLTRLHVKAATACRDAAQWDNAYGECFDTVLLDVPCSGLGLLQDKPDIKFRKGDDDVAALAKIQRELLDVCATYVRPGGTLLYVTCTISRRENEEQIAGFLRGNLNFALVKEQQWFPHTDGVEGFYFAEMKKCT